MANLQMNIDKFLGINATGNDLKKGELANMQNFKITDGYDVEKRSGYTGILDTATTKPIKGQWYGKIGSTYFHLFASDGHIYQNDGDGTVTDLGTLTDAPTNFFFFKDAVYIQNGTEYKKWTGSGTIQSVVGHIPIVAVATLPAGGGTIYEAINCLNVQRIQRFNGDGNSTTYQLLETNVNSIDSVLISGELQIVNTHYTVDVSNGRVVFSTAPASGINNVEIKYSNSSSTKFFDGVGGQQSFNLEDTNITSVSSITMDGKNVIVGGLNFPDSVFDLANDVVSISPTVTPFWDNQGVLFTTSGTPPTPLVSGTIYYIYYVNSTSFGLRATVGGSKINLGGSPSGTYNLRPSVANTTTGIVTIYHTNVGVQNIAITYKSNLSDQTQISNFTNANVYGGANDNRVFLYGGSNRIRYSGLANGVPSAEYFPVLNFIDIGNDNEYVTQLSTQYDRQLIMKEHSIYWCAYEYDTSLGVTFPTYPLNDNVGCTFLGTGQTIRNNPWFIYQKSIYEITSPYMRDERYVKYVSDKIQPLLDALTFTNVHTLDNDEEKEYWLCIGRNVFVWNHNLETWHRFYLADTVTSICEVGSAIVIGTTGGQLMTFDTSLTDNGTAINGYIETDWLDYGTPNRSKYMDYAWFTIKPHGNSLAVVSYAVDSTDEREVGRIQMTTNYEPRTRKLRVKAKKFNRIKLFIRNTEQSELTIEGISVPVSVANLTR